jgi:hypothetical protein
MRRFGFAITTVLLLVAASFVSSTTAIASGGTRHPGPAGPHAIARSAHVAAATTSSRAPAIRSSLALSCDGQFDAIASPNGTGHNVLISTAAISFNDVWSVGFQTSVSNVDRTLAEHWTGGSWSVVPTVNSGSSHNDLFGVSGSSSTNVWAVGAYETNTTTHTTASLALRWNGTSWSKVTTVNPSSYSYLFAVTALSSSNVWAVGTYYNFTVGAYQNLVEHFNGSSWSVVASPNTDFPDTWNQLFAVSAFSATHIWAVGSLAPNAGPRKSLALHWNGSTWLVVTTFNAAGDNEILGVSALEPGHAVGVGYGGFISGSTPAQAYQWGLFVTPSTSTTSLLNLPVTGDVVLENVARSANSVWAVGYYRSTVSAPRQTLVWHATWDSSAHTLVFDSSPGTSANPGAVNSVLFGVAAVSPSVFWAAGYSNSGSSDQTLAELYCALNLDLVAPATAVPGSAFSVTVTAKNPDTSTATDYRGTVHFTSSDSQAVLPADYAFTSGDAGAHTFSGVVLKDTSNQPTTITVSDKVTPFISDSAAITVACPGVCQAPAATPGSRDVLPGPTSSPSPRAANQSTGGTPGPRTPWGLVFPLGLFAFALSAHRRGRSKEKSNVQDEP